MILRSDTWLAVADALARHREHGQICSGFEQDRAKRGVIIEQMEGSTPRAPAQKINHSVAGLRGWRLLIEILKETWQSTTRRSEPPCSFEWLESSPRSLGRIADLGQAFSLRFFLPLPTRGGSLIQRISVLTAQTRNAARCRAIRTTSVPPYNQPKRYTLASGVALHARDLREFCMKVF